MTTLKLCKTCLLPETHETILFSDDGICNVCLNKEKRLQVDWQVRKQKLSRLIESIKIKSADYDCVIPYSGGKDSTFTLLYAVKDLLLKPLVVSFDHGFYRPTLVRNRERILKALGVDFLIFTPNWQLVRNLMLTSLRDKGDFCWHCHTGVMTYPVRIAIEKDIPLVLWGESSTEYTNYFELTDFPQVDEVLYNKITNLGISARDMLARLGGDYKERDLKPFSFPSLSEMQDSGITSVPLGNFIEWDTKSNVRRIKAELGWQGDEVEGVPSDYTYEKIECMMQGVRDYLKYRKRGYARTTHLTSIDIRNNRMSRESGLALVNQYEGQKPFSLNLFMEMLEISEDEIERIVAQHRVYPWDDSTPVKIGKKPADYDIWVEKLLRNSI